MLMKSLFLLAAFTYAKSCWTEQINEQIKESRESIKALRSQLAETSCMWREQTEQRIQDLTTRINKQICDISATKEQLKVGLTAAMEAMGRVTQFESNANDVLVEQKKHREKLAAGEQAAKELVQLDHDIVSAEEKCATKLLEAKARKDELMAAAAYDEDNNMFSGHRRRGAAIVKREGDMELVEVVEGDADAESTEVAVVDEPCPKLMMKLRLQGFAAGSLIMALIILFIVPMFKKDDKTTTTTTTTAAPTNSTTAAPTPTTTAAAAVTCTTQGECSDVDGLPNCFRTDTPAPCDADAIADGGVGCTCQPRVNCSGNGDGGCGASGNCRNNDNFAKYCPSGKEFDKCTCEPLPARRLSQRKLSSRRWR